ncbi:MAG TPA: DUF4440 domain-containing protein [Burkholderiales bacterium]|nr:DUF4440 domain-containing protein [Burkholderiales bacterium]
MRSAHPSLANEIRNLEERLLQPQVRRSRALVDDLLAEDFVEIASDGRAYDKREVMQALENERPKSRSLSDWRLAQLADHVVFATFRSMRRDEASGETVESLRSSIWVHRQGRWQLLFHQGTICAPS